MARPPAPSPTELASLDPDGDFQRRLRDDRNAVGAMSYSGDLEPLKVIAHQLAGAAATFGYAPLGDVAIELDEQFRKGRKVTAGEVARLLAALEQALRMPRKSA